MFPFENESVLAVVRFIFGRLLVLRASFALAADQRPSEGVWESVWQLAGTTLQLLGGRVLEFGGSFRSEGL